MSQEPLSILLPAIGLFQSDELAYFTPDSRSSGVSFVHSATNVVISERRYRTRPAWRELKLESAPGGWSTAATQGAIAYDPRAAGTGPNARGQTGIVESAAGKLYRITPGSRTFEVEDISSGQTGSVTSRIVWLVQAMNYVIRSDRNSPTQIWDGTTTTISTGYNPAAPSSSRLPNFASATAYTNRIFIANNGVEVIAGDQAHASDRYSNADLLNTSQQATDITSQSFSSPSTLGEVIGMFVVNSYRGGGISAQADIYIATQAGGLWALLGGQPRDTWASTAMIRVISEDTGPTGPFAAWAALDELIFRSSDGISSIKTLSQERNQVGNPHIELGQEILPLLRKDPPDLLFHASLTVSTEQQRLLCTVFPKIDGPQRWHRAYISAALAPARTRTPEPMAWEAVSTLPEAMGEVIQFIRIRDLGCQRVLALLRKSDGTKGLAEYSVNWGDDRLADGTAVPIPWQILTRKLTREGEYSLSRWSSVYLQLLGIRDKVDIRIFARGNLADPLKQVYSGTFTNQQWGALCGTDLTGYAAGTACIGEIFKDITGPWLEILIQGEGCCVVDLAIGGISQGRQTAKPEVQDPKVEGEKLCQFDIFRRA